MSDIQPSKGSILVVDDDQGMRETLFQILAAKGYEVYTASSGLEAVELLEDFGFDIVLMDIVMPGMNGVETLRAMRAVNPNQKVIMMTAYSELPLVKEALSEGALHVLNKPFRVEKLLPMILDVVQARRVGQPQPAARAQPADPEERDPSGTGPGDEGDD